MKGVYEFDVESGKAGFRFDMVAGSIMEEREGKPISDVLGDLAQMAIEAKAGNASLRISLLLNVLVGAAQSYAESEGLEIPSRSKVASWIGYIDASELYKMVFEGMQMFVPKNSKAPTKGASQSQQESTIGAESQ